MKLNTSAQAGSENKSDVLVTVSPAEELTVKLLAKPIIAKQFGARIEVRDGGGALDFAIRARVRCALRRAKGGAAS